MSRSSSFVRSGTLSLTLLGAFPSANTPDQWLSERTQPWLGALLERVRLEHQLPGLAVAVVRGMIVTDSAVAGVRRAGTTDSLKITDRFHLASCTKSMTAMVAATIVNQGKLTWESRLVDVIPELRRTIQPEYESVTLAQLLAHAGRIPQYTQPTPSRMAELRALPGSPTAQRLRFVTQVLSQESPNHAAGDGAYSNAGYAAAAVMMERATGESWEDLVAKRILQPLEMKASGFGWPATLATPAQPRGHYREGDRTIEQPIDRPFLPPALWPAGAVSGSVTDVARYAADQLNGLKGRPALLPSATYERLHRTLTGASSGFTLGWGRREDPRWGTVHYGAGSGGTFFVRILIVPERDIAVVAAANSGDAARATREVMDSVLVRSIQK